jgi:hypothetical protein
MYPTLTSIKVWAAAAWADGMLLEEERLAMELIGKQPSGRDDLLARRLARTPRGRLETAIVAPPLSTSALPRHDSVIIPE